VSGDGGNVVDLARERRERHQAAPRDKEGYYRYSALRGYWGTSEPTQYDYPLTTICKGCGKTIKRETPADEWEHFQW
jgi:hypothetical protein